MAENALAVRRVHIYKYIYINIGMDVIYAKHKNFFLHCILVYFGHCRGINWSTCHMDEKAISLQS